MAYPMAIPVHVPDIAFDCAWLTHLLTVLGDDLMSLGIVRILLCIGMYLVSQHSRVQVRNKSLCRRVRNVVGRLPPSTMECGQARLVMFRGSSSFTVAVAKVAYTLAVILHILQVDRDDDKGTG
jgi:hypothetical protein